MRSILYSSFLLFVCNISLTGCSFKPVTKAKDITYLPADAKLKTDDVKLDIYSPKNTETKKDVFIFLHGGGWSHGKKSQYKFFGKDLARKGIVAVIADYPLSPQADYNDMAIASVKAVKWVKDNIDKYGGDPSRIFISGHSAGGHIAALICVKEKYFDSIGISNPLKGVILIDAAGLDMKKYLTEQTAKGMYRYTEAFTKDTAKWRDASPIYHLHKGVLPMLLFVGGKTYSNIKDSNERFATELAKNSSTMGYKVVKGKHHIPMIFQFYNFNNSLYKDILQFMNDRK
jgi:acetyl esterase/lipase